MTKVRRGRAGSSLGARGALVGLLTLVLLVVGAPGAARAQVGAGSPAPPTSPLRLDGAPLLGGGTPAGTGWFSCRLVVANTGTEQLEGTVELVSQVSWSPGEEGVTTRAPFAVPGGGSVTVELPTHGFYLAPPQLEAVLRDARGTELLRTGLPESRAIDPILLSLAVPARLTPWLRGQRVYGTGRSTRHGSYDMPTIEVAVPEVNPASGELVVPQRAAGYANATVVLAPSDVLARLGDQARQALADWVLAGGALAIVTVRPEDLRGPLVAALLGGEPRATAAPPDLGRPRAFVVAPEQPSLGQGPTRAVAQPAPEVRQALAGYAGGNLRDTQWGAAATYGLGEVHFLGFDPTREPGVNDPWVHHQMRELVAHAWNRKVHIALPHAEVALDLQETTEIRRLLDPNEKTRWAIAAATLILLLYSVMAGPLSFHLATRKGRPLRALWHLPLWSLGTIGVIVGLGFLAKGVRGEARHFTVLEAGGGMGRAAVTRFRAFYTPGSNELRVSVAEFGNVLDVVGRTTDAGRVLVVDRDGARLEELRATPWQTVLVREDGFTSLGAGVSLVPTGADVTVHNRAGRDLVGAIVSRPDGDAYYFARIADGEQIAATQGEKVSWARFSPGAVSSQLVKRLDADEAGLGTAWEALARYAFHATQWWPAGTPVLIAQLAGGEGQLEDSGLVLREDRVLVRVVGFGGKP